MNTIKPAVDKQYKHTEKKTRTSQSTTEPGLAAF